MFLSLLLIFVFAGCNAKEQQSKSENKGNETAVTDISLQQRQPPQMKAVNKITNML
ncbi:hypothetical protein R4Z09_22270 [Niallia oryzisoli]|uniref:Uncharacterized protein n=1 Tax=Niallia oryzisoli TaxID=1737571 RepID=A0ABZ2CAC2_9BACI